MCVHIIRLFRDEINIYMAQNDSSLLLLTSIRNNRRAAMPHEYTSLRPIDKVKQRRVRLVFGSVTVL